MGQFIFSALDLIPSDENATIRPALLDFLLGGNRISTEYPYSSEPRHTFHESSKLSCVLSKPFAMPSFGSAPLLDFYWYSGTVNSNGNTVGWMASLRAMGELDDVRKAFAAWNLSGGYSVPVVAFNLAIDQMILTTDDELEQGDLVQLAVRRDYTVADSHAAPVYLNNLVLKWTD